MTMMKDYEPKDIYAVMKQTLIAQQQRINELVGDLSLWESFTEEETKLARKSSIADLIIMLRAFKTEAQKQ